MSWLEKSSFPTGNFAFISHTLPNPSPFQDNYQRLTNISPNFVSRCKKPFSERLRIYSLCLGKYYRPQNLNEFGMKAACVNCFFFLSICLQSVRLTQNRVVLFNTGSVKDSLILYGEFYMEFSWKAATTTTKKRQSFNTKHGKILKCSFMTCFMYFILLSCIRFFSAFFPHNINICAYC